jgi:hypothetical protein
MGYTPQEIRLAHFPIQEAKGLLSLAQLKQAGYPLAQLREHFSDRVGVRRQASCFGGACILRQAGGQGVADGRVRHLLGRP